MRELEQQDLGLQFAVRRRRACAAFVVGLMLATTSAATAQTLPDRNAPDTQPRAQPRPGMPDEKRTAPSQKNDSPRIEPAPGQGGQPSSPDSNAANAADAAKDPLKKLGEATPTTAEERDRILDNLYALLATAETEEAAAKIATAIERIWMYSGSDTVSLLMERSAKALKDKNSALAIKLLDAVVDLAPDYAEGWNRRAYVHFTDQSIERAMGDLRRALALDANHFKAMEGLGQIMKDLGRKQAALQIFRRLLDIHPHAPGVKQAIDELAREIDGQGI